MFPSMDVYIWENKGQIKWTSSPGGSLDVFCGGNDDVASPRPTFFSPFSSVFVVG